MKTEIRSQCISITKKVFQQPLGQYVSKILPSFLVILPENNLSLEKIEEKLEKWEYSSLEEWHNDIVGLLNSVSHECDQNLSLIFNTVIQMIEDEVEGFLSVKEDDVVKDIQYAIEHYLPNSKFSFYHERKSRPSIPENRKKRPENTPEFSIDSKSLLKKRIYNIQSTRELSRIGKIILSVASIEEGVTESKGVLSVVFENLSPFTLQIIQNYINKIEKEE